jgi:hypothetical protein
VLGRRADVIERRLPAVRRQAQAAQQLGEPGDRLQRGAQLVVERRDELGLRPAGGLRRRPGDLGLEPGAPLPFGGPTLGDVEQVPALTLPGNSSSRIIGCSGVNAGKGRVGDPAADDRTAHAASTAAKGTAQS